MPLSIVRDDISRMRADAIVVPTDAVRSGDGGADLAVHKAAGPELDAACASFVPLEPGEVQVTGGYALPCRYVIHTFGPIWRGGDSGEVDVLRRCISRSLDEARALGCRSVAVPLIATGTYGFPRELALSASIDAIRSFLEDNEIDVRLVVYDKESYEIGIERRLSIKQFIDDRYVSGLREIGTDLDAQDMIVAAEEAKFAAPAPMMPLAARSLSDLVDQVDESFSQMLLRKIDERGMSDVECYKRANIDRRHFSKIRSDVHYSPKKNTVLALAIALRLTLDETRDLLLKAGYALTRSSVTDIIIEYHITEGRYDIFEVNEDLFQFDQRTLGA